MSDIENRKSKIENRKTGTKEWSEASLNVCVGCAHGCLYCYARANALRRGWIARGEDWTTERIRPENWIRRQRPCRRRVEGTVMLPTTHDLTPATLDACLLALELAVGFGNRVLVVTKPHLPIAQEVIRRLGNFFLPEFRALIEFRVSLGSYRDPVLRFWEPHAPPAEERLACLAAFHAAGYRTSVSAEPLLSPPDAADLVAMAAARGAEEIWIGALNQIRARTSWALAVGTDADRTRLEREIADLEARQTPAAVRGVYDRLSRLPDDVRRRIRWKDSYQRLLGMKGPTG
jgi:DNA repair photolyase